MGILVIITTLILVGMFNGKSDKELSDEASQLPPFTQKEAEEYYKTLK